MYFQGKSLWSCYSQSDEINFIKQSSPKFWSRIVQVSLYCRSVAHLVFIAGFLLCCLDFSSHHLFTASTVWEVERLMHDVRTPVFPAIDTASSWIVSAPIGWVEFVLLSDYMCGGHSLTQSLIQLLLIKYVWAEEYLTGIWR